MKELNEADLFCKKNGLTLYEISYVKDKLMIYYKGHIFDDIYELDIFVDFLNKIGWDK